MSNCNGLSVTEYVKQNQQKQENTKTNKNKHTRKRIVFKLINDA